MTTPTTTHFASAARVLSDAVHAAGLVVPGFRCPPRVIGVDRTVRRAPGGVGGVVAVRLTDRPFTAAVSDMIEGVVVLNNLVPPEADRVRTLLWRSMLHFTVQFNTRAHHSDRSADSGVPRVA